MKVTAVLLLALASASAGSLSNLKPVLPRDRNIEQSFESRIIGGKTAQDGEIPYQAALAFTGSSSSWFCGGSILSRLCILTAAHCTQNASWVDVYVGSINLKEGQKYTVNSSNFRQHPDFNITVVLNDISLILLNEPLVFGSNIQSIGLPSRNGPYDTYEGQTVMVSGWGLIWDLGILQPYWLQYAKVTVISNEVCEKSYPNYIKLSHLCTDVTKGQATCSGDSGGPLALDAAASGKIQIGIVSFGSSKGCSKAPSAYTRVTYFRDWIYNTSGI